MSRYNPRHIFLCLLLLPAACASVPTSGQQSWIRTELYFGLSRPAGPDISETEFQDFLDRVVTPRFPDGFTVIDSQGRWREGQGRIRTEPSRVVVILHPSNAASAGKIEEIRAAYKTRFQQESVLRTDDRETVAF